ncbi:MAG TPA: glycosyltransferase family 2 protein [Elusimicrobiales bacterium]|nr:glycosyltransferase family 2 protein [Elusimicrobiales bacterium]
MKKIIVLPAYNAVKTLAETLASLSPAAFDEIILVDDCSSDGTYELALKLGIKAVRHERNRGYGGNQKTCYTLALEHGADIVVMLHPDYQYDPRVIPFMTGIIEKDICDVVLGNRIRTRAEALSGGMPVYKYIANRFLTGVENLVAGQNMGEWHSGLRAYSRAALEKINWLENSEGFAFDSEFLFVAAFKGLRLGDIPVPAKYFPDMSSLAFAGGVRYGLMTLMAAGEFLLNKTGLLRTARYR